MSERDQLLCVQLLADWNKRACLVAGGKLVPVFQSYDLFGLQRAAVARRLPPFNAALIMAGGAARIERALVAKRARKRAL